MSPALRVISCDMYRGNDNFVQSSEQWCCDGVSDCSFDHSSSENIVIMRALPGCLAVDLVLDIQVPIIRGIVLVVGESPVSLLSNLVTMAYIPSGIVLSRLIGRLMQARCGEFGKPVFPAHWFWVSVLENVALRHLSALLLLPCLVVF
jgi:hypothetical protein